MTRESLKNEIEHIARTIRCNRIVRFDKAYLFAPDNDDNAPFQVLCLRGNGKLLISSDNEKGKTVYQYSRELLSNMMNCYEEYLKECNAPADCKN